jgi:R67 dihydrofolate reductase
MSAVCPDCGALVSMGQIFAHKSRDCPFLAKNPAMGRGGMRVTDEMVEAARQVARRQSANEMRAALEAAIAAAPWFVGGSFAFGDRVQKRSGSDWHGHVCGFYKTGQTAIGYCVKSERERNSVQLYPETALERTPVP